MDFRKPRVWDYTITTGTALTCFALGSVTAPFHGALGTMIDPSLLLVGLVLCGVGATGATAIERRGETDAETDGVIVDWNTGQILPPNPPRPTEPEPRRIPNLGEPVVMHSTSVSLNLVQKDLRWQQFCNAVLVHKTPMTQSKWTGKGRLFSKPEFAAQLGEWEQKRIIKLANPKNRRDGFTLSGGEGRRYFSDVANGKKWIPLPYSD
jgi:hypothetical protein